MRLNMGCGFNKLENYVNSDIMALCEPDMIVDMEKIPWPFESDSAEEILFNHSLEHVGQLRETFLDIVKEVYRVAKPGALVKINVPNPNHPDYLGDPTHVRPITPQMLVTLDKTVNEDWIKRGLPGTPIGKYMDVDFKTVGFTGHAGVWYEIVLEARKQTGAALDEAEESGKIVTLCRYGGLGDVALVLAAAGAIKKTKGWRVEVMTSNPYVELAEHCPHVDWVVTPDIKPRGEYFDLNSAVYGQRDGHQLDNYLRTLGIEATPGDKNLELDYPHSSGGGGSKTHKRVLLHPGITDPNRTWPKESWEELARMLLSAGYEVMCIGKSDSPDGRSAYKLDTPGVKDRMDFGALNIPFVGIMLTLASSDLLVSCDSGPIQLAGATDIGIVGIYSVVRGSQRLPFRHGKLGWNATVIEPEFPYAPCYSHMRDFPKENLGKFFAEWCPHRRHASDAPYMCMKQIAPHRVFNACLDLLER